MLAAMGAVASTPLRDWPSIEERDRFLSVVPGIQALVERNSWDAFEVDRFIFRTKVEKGDFLAIKQAYPSIDEKTLRASLAALGFKP